MAMPILGCIADDSTGATDLASQLVGAGMRTIQMIGVPQDPLNDPADAVVVALKSRTIGAEYAVAQSLAALEWLQTQGCAQFYFKYCSTFDSTPAGNIGPVTDALMAALGCAFTIACPALPANKRTVYNGYLFANNVLLNESGMQEHPLTPMRDANLVRVLAAQTRHRVGLIDYAALRGGAHAVERRMRELQANGIGIAVCDALEDDHLAVLAHACRDLALVTAGSGLAQSLPTHFAQRLDDRGPADTLPVITGREAIISGSCSRATLAQVAHAQKYYPSFYVDALALADDYTRVVDQARAFGDAKLATGPILVYSSSTPEAVRWAQTKLGAAQASTLIERALADIACALVTRQGVRRVLIAGGETAGAAIDALGVQGLRIGPRIDPGVPWTTTIGRCEPLALALKSGNFGATDFMTKAWGLLP
jgi:uncharacterized protein YgbK (DUF1537 family)